MSDVALPETLQRLTFGDYYNQLSCGWHPPAGLQELRYSGNSFNCSLSEVALPSSLRALMLGDRFNQSLGDVTLPDNLECLELGSGHDVQKHWYADSMTWPSQLRRLRVDNLFPGMSMDRLWPSTVTELVLGDYFALSLQSLILPCNLKHWTLVLSSTKVSWTLP